MPPPAPPPAPVSFGLVAGRPVFMDVTSDSYFRLGEQEEQGFLERWTKRGRGQRLSQLEATRLGLAGVPVEADSIAPTLSLIDDVVPLRAGLGDLIRIWPVLRRARADIARRPIAELLSALTARPAFRYDRDVHPAALRWLAARRLLPAAPQCLVDTLALARWLGPAPQLMMVFGVKLDPFEAHCWLQHADWLLNDRLDTIAAFSPVRVVECAAATR